MVQFDPIQVTQVKSGVRIYVKRGRRNAPSVNVTLTMTEAQALTQKLIRTLTGLRLGADGKATTE